MKPDFNSSSVSVPVPEALSPESPYSSWLWFANSLIATKLPELCMLQPSGSHGSRYGSKPLLQPGGGDCCGSNQLGTLRECARRKHGKGGLTPSRGLSRKNLMSWFKHPALSSAPWEVFLLGLAWESMVVCERLGKGLHSQKEAALLSPLTFTSPAADFNMLPTCFGAALKALLWWKGVLLSSPENLPGCFTQPPSTRNHAKMRFCRGAYLLLLLWAKREVHK